MPAPIVSQDDLQRVHRALRLTVPLDQASPLILTTLAVIAHCWSKNAASNATQSPRYENRCRPLRAAAPDQAAIDLKRRAAGDFE